MSEAADRALQEYAGREPDDPPLRAHEAARLCRWFLAGYEAGKASRTLGPATAEVLGEFRRELKTWGDPANPEHQDYLGEMMFRLHVIRAFLAEWEPPA